MKIRVGQGIDVHPFEAGRPLILGGVKIDHARGLKGHSDADALSHAVCDALLGAAALGDIGRHFPDTDPRQKGRNSLEFLAETRKMLNDRNWKIGNVDATVVTEEPMLETHVPDMRNNLARALEIDVDDVSVKATRPEKLGALGRSEGLLVFAVALIERK